MQDKELVEGLKNGDQEAFRYLVDQYQVKVHNLCYGYLHDQQDAEDIAQDVFVEVFNSVQRFRGESGLSTWIYRIAVNKALNRRKKQQRMMLFSRLTGSTNPNPEKSISQMQAHPEYQPDHDLKKQENRKILHYAIDQLPQPQKTAFLLSKYENLSYKEIANVMDTSTSAVESLLFRAKSNLRKRLSVIIEKK